MRRAAHAWARLCGAAALAVPGASLAAEGQPGPSWSGVTVGLIGAASRNIVKGYTVKDDGTFGSNASQESARVDDRSMGFGVTLGYRTRFEPGLVAGLEADVMALGHDATNTSFIGVTDQPVASLRYETKVLSTVRATAGWAIGNVLVFGTGGIALGQEVEHRTQYRLVAGTSSPVFTESSDATRLGFAVGAGAEWRIVGGWALRADVLHVRFRKEAFRFPNGRGGAQGSFTAVQGRVASNNGEMNLVRVALTYTFSID